MNKNAAGLYIHIPFCAKKCLFCSFAVTIGQSHRTDDYVHALGKEASAHRGRDITTVYFGGGTPSFLDVGQWENLMRMVRENFNIAPDAEITAEINPENIDANKADALKKFGINRASVGVQSFNDAYLKFLGRAHDKATALRAIDTLRQAGFANINVDLMYGFPGQTRDELAADLKAVIALAPQHVSVYTLTIEPNSRFYARQMKLDDDQKLADDYVFVAETLEKAGIGQYEVSNFATPGFASKHNTAYWQGKDYVGLGMGAHAFLDGRRSWNNDQLAGYLKGIEQGNAVAGSEDLDKRTRLLERLIFGLRMNEGINPYIIEKEEGCQLPDEVKGQIDFLVREGLLVREGDKLKTTMAGRLVLDEIATRLL